MAKSVVWLGLGLAASVGLIGCQPQGSASKFDGATGPKVVATSTILADLTRQIGGNAIQLTGILDPGSDPHVYEPVPQDTIALEQADLILYNGYNLEPNLIKLIRSTGRDAIALAVGEVVTPLDFTYQGQTQPDPHVWGDVSNAIAMVIAIQDRLVALDPAQAAQYRTNAQRLSADLLALDGWIIAQVATVPPDHRQLVTTHDAFQYYAQAYGFTVVGTLIGISTEEQPSAQTVSHLVEAVRAAGVPAIFAETTINPALITTVASEAGVVLAPQPLYADSIGAPGSRGDSYIAMIKANTCTIVVALAGRCQL